MQSTYSSGLVWLRRDLRLSDNAALAAQDQLWARQGARNTWFCGAHFGHGFHEDALSSGLAAADGVLASFAEPKPLAAD